MNFSKKRNVAVLQSSAFFLHYLYWYFNIYRFLVFWLLFFFTLYSLLVTKFMFYTVWCCIRLAICILIAFSIICFFLVHVKFSEMERTCLFVFFLLIKVQSKRQKWRGGCFSASCRRFPSELCCWSCSCKFLHCVFCWRASLTFTPSSLSANNFQASGPKKMNLSCVFV